MSPWRKALPSRNEYEGMLPAPNACAEGTRQRRPVAGASPRGGKGSATAAGEGARGGRTDECEEYGQSPAPAGAARGCHVEVGDGEVGAWSDEVDRGRGERVPGEGCRGCAVGNLVRCSKLARPGEGAEGEEGSDGVRSPSLSSAATTRRCSVSPFSHPSPSSARTRRWTPTHGSCSFTASTIRRARTAQARPVARALAATTSSCSSPRSTWTRSAASTRATATRSCLSASTRTRAGEPTRPRRPRRHHAHARAAFVHRSTAEAFDALNSKVKDDITARPSSSLSRRERAESRELTQTARANPSSRSSSPPSSTLTATSTSYRTASSSSRRRAGSRSCAVRRCPLARESGGGSRRPARSDAVPAPSHRASRTGTD